MIASDPLWHKTIEEDSEWKDECAYPADEEKGVHEVRRGTRTFAEPLNLDSLESRIPEESLEPSCGEATKILWLWHFVGDKGREHVPCAAFFQDTMHFARKLFRFAYDIQRIEKKHVVKGIIGKRQERVDIDRAHSIRLHPIGAYDIERAWQKRQIARVRTAGEIENLPRKRARTIFERIVKEDAGKRSALERTAKDCAERYHIRTARLSHS